MLKVFGKKILTYGDLEETIEQNASRTCIELNFSSGAHNEVLSGVEVMVSKSRQNMNPAIIVGGYVYSIGLLHNHHVTHDKVSKALDCGHDCIAKGHKLWKKWKEKGLI